MAGGLGAVALPVQYGVTAGFLGLLCAFLLAVAVVALLLLLSTPEDLRRLWWTATALSAVWTAGAAWEARREDV